MVHGMAIMTSPARFLERRRDNTNAGQTRRQSAPTQPFRLGLCSNQHPIATPHSNAPSSSSSRLQPRQHTVSRVLSTADTDDIRRSTLPPLPPTPPLGSSIEGSVPCLITRLQASSVRWTGAHFHHFTDLGLAVSHCFPSGPIHQYL